MFTPEILQVAQAKIKNLYQVTDKQMPRVAELLASVKAFKDTERFPDSFHVKSSSRRITYAVNLSTLTCQCEDWQKHNQPGQQTIHLCKHLLACFLYRHCVAEQARQQKELESQDWHIALDAMMRRAGLETA